MDIKIFLRISRIMISSLPGWDLCLSAAILDFKMAAIQNRFSTLSQVLDKIRLQTLPDTLSCGWYEVENTWKPLLLTKQPIEKVNSTLKSVNARKVDWNVQRDLAHVWITSFVLRMHVAALATVGVRIHTINYTTEDIQFHMWEGTKRLVFTAIIS